MKFQYFQELKIFTTVCCFIPGEHIEQNSLPCCQRLQRGRL